jgi:hypothetical protein
VNYPVETAPQAAVLEILERRSGTPSGGIGDEIVAPTEVWLNGVRLLTPNDSPIRVHELTVGQGGDDVVTVTLTLFAKRVVVDQVWRGEVAG